MDEKKSSMPRRSQDIPEEYSEYERALARAIGVRIRERRRELQLTQEEVRTRMESESVHISKAHFSRIEAGERMLSAAVVVALSKVLGISYIRLLEGNDL